MGNKNASMPTSERRQRPRRKDTFYRLVLILNALAWFTLVAALVLFHFARPDFVTGVQQYWGADADTSWSAGYLVALKICLGLCFVLTIIALLMRKRRNRRRTDAFGANLFLLLTLTIIGLLGLITVTGSG
ncbi:hypothetical protein [Alteromonas sp. CYL-A6]|uniref:hypothetical protein n=1 Tax=Alteromonas nitratireducens TaxID=3390813 RepID=UPI0034B34166